jgi:predicted acetyltransferase
MYHAAHESETGGVDGYVSYRLNAEWTGDIAMNRLAVVELLATDPSSYKALWHYVLETDLVKTVTCWRARVDEPLRWMLADPRWFEVRGLSDSLWVGLLDVPRALSARAYGIRGELVLQVHSAFPQATTQRYGLQAGETDAPGAVCEITTRTADLALGISELGAAYLGGVTFTALAAAGRIQEMTPGAIERADAMFRTPAAPFCSTDF